MGAHLCRPVIIHRYRCGPSAHNVTLRGLVYTEFTARVHVAGVGAQLGLGVWVCKYVVVEIQSMRCCWLYTK